MMSIETSYSMYALLACNAALAGAAAIAILRLQRMVKMQKAFWDSPTASMMSVPAQSDGLMHAMNARFEQLQADMGKLRVEEKPAARSGALLLENAVRMAKLGASLDDLVRTCGLSNTEARLLLRVHAAPTPSERVN